MYSTGEDRDGNGDRVEALGIEVTLEPRTKMAAPSIDVHEPTLS
jgi:hypothetical protein